jgi:hypothetical protein
LNGAPLASESAFSHRLAIVALALAVHFVTSN